MTDNRSLRCALERALAFAHAALEDPTPERVESARERAAEVLAKLKPLHRTSFTLSEARQLIGLANQVRLRSRS
jgi:hypothetical protein